MKILSKVMNFLDGMVYGRAIEGRFPDGRKYRISADGGLSLDLDDPQTIEAIQKKLKEIDDTMRISQPHMYDKDGKFVGGVLKMGCKQ